MATVKFPLLSLSATGSIKGVIDFKQVRDTDEITYQKNRNLTSFQHTKPPRIVTGRGIVCAKRGARGRKRAKKTEQQRQNQNIFSVALKLGTFIEKHSLIYTDTNPAPIINPPSSWSSRFINARGSSNELRKFPGQVIRRSTSWRRRTKEPTTPRGYVMRSFMINQAFTLRQAQNVWLQLDDEQKERFIPTGNAPFDRLVGLDILEQWTEASIRGANYLMWYVYTKYFFEQRGVWRQFGPQIQLWTTPGREIDNPFRRALYEDFTSSTTSISDVSSPPWERQ